MFFYNFTNDFKNEFNNITAQNNYYIDYFNNLLKFSIAQRKTLLEFMNKITTYIDNAIYVNDTNTLLSILEDLKKNLDNSNINISTLKEFLKMLKQIKYSLSKLDKTSTYSSESNDIISLEDELISFNNKLNGVQSNLIANSIDIENFMLNAINHFDFMFINSTLAKLNEKDKDKDTLSPNEISENTENYTPLQEQTLESDIKTAPLLEETLEVQIVDNKKLIISEKDQKVFLPYMVTDLENILKTNPSKYESINEIVQSEYVLPFNKFSNPTISRFREAFKLARKKEKQSIQYAFSLALELSVNYNLHPAIITACNNLDELDIYLDYLENGETEKFSCFDIVFEMAPVVLKKQSL